jgi:hypothetical protein
VQRNLTLPRCKEVRQWFTIAWLIEDLYFWIVVSGRIHHHHGMDAIFMNPSEEIRDFDNVVMVVRVWAVIGIVDGLELYLLV